MMIKDMDSFWKKYDELYNYAGELYDTLTNAGVNDVGDINDWGKMGRIVEKLMWLGRLWDNYIIFVELIECAKEEEIRFSLQKACHEAQKMILEIINDDTLYVCKTWDFTDYRCRNFQNRMYHDVIELRDFFTGEMESEIRKTHESDSKTK